MRMAPIRLTMGNRGRSRSFQRIGIGGKDLDHTHVNDSGNTQLSGSSPPMPTTTFKNKEKLPEGSQKAKIAEFMCLISDFTDIV